MGRTSSGPSGPSGWPTVARSAKVGAILVLCLGFAPIDASTDTSLQRLRPPASLKCSRDHLTAYQGRVLDYRRGKQDITLRVSTDDGTTESVSLKWAASEKPETWFLLRGEPFKDGDWKRIESGPGKLADETRIIVWVCDDGSKPVLDWRPKEAGLARLLSYFPNR